MLWGASVDRPKPPYQPSSPPYRIQIPILPALSLMPLQTSPLLFMTQRRRT